MTKKDFKLFADLLVDYEREGVDVIGISRLIDDFARIFQRDNERFDYAKWRDYINQRLAVS